MSITAVIVSQIVATTGADLNHFVPKILNKFFIVLHREHNHLQYNHHYHNIHSCSQRIGSILQTEVPQVLGMFLKAS